MALLVGGAGPSGCPACCPRQGLRVHYPSQTAAPSRDFPDFLLRAPAAGAGRPESGSTTEVSESEEEEDAAAEGPAGRQGEEPGNRGSALQEAPPNSECEQRGGGAAAAGQLAQVGQTGRLGGAPEQSGDLQDDLNLSTVSP